MPCTIDNKFYITETPPAGFPVFYGVENEITIEFDLDLFGHTLRFIAYKEAGSPKILEVLQGTKLSYITFVEGTITKTRVLLRIDEADSILIPTIRTPALVPSCSLTPTCFYDIFGNVGGKDYPLLSGFIQGTPTAKVAT